MSSQSRIIKVVPSAGLVDNKEAHVIARINFVVAWYKRPAIMFALGATAMALFMNVWR